jgi:hypothetical protein
MAVLDDIEFARGVAAMGDRELAAEGARYWRGLAESSRRRAELDKRRRKARRVAMHREYARRSRSRRRRTRA